MKIAIVDDEAQTREQLAAMCASGASALGISAEPALFLNGEVFLSDSAGDEQLVLLDIQMGDMDGMEVARRLRERGSDAAIVFITNVAQYALEGYRVEALDYLIKPVDQRALTECLRRVVRHLRERASKTVILRADEGTCRVAADKLLWIEAVNHKTVVHAEDGCYHCAGTLNSMENLLRDCGFFRCHAAYLVNLSRVDRVRQNDACIGAEVIPVSRHRRQEFLQRLAGYWGDQL